MNDTFKEIIETSFRGVIWNDAFDAIDDEFRRRGWAERVDVVPVTGWQPEDCGAAYVRLTTARRMIVSWPEDDSWLVRIWDDPEDDPDEITVPTAAAVGILMVETCIADQAAAA